MVLPSLVAINSTSWTVLALSASVRRDPHADDGFQTVLVMCGGEGDIYDELNDGPTVYADAKSYAQSAKTAGFDKVLAVTIAPGTAAWFTAPMNTARKAANDLLIGNADAVFDAVVDLAGDSTLSNPGAPHSDTTWFGDGTLSNPANATNYADGLHWAIPGAQSAADQIAPALTALGAT